MAYNYQKLLGRIKEKGYTQRKLASNLGMNPGTLSAKLNNKSKFTQREMNGICKMLDISNEEIGIYFFAG